MALTSTRQEREWHLYLGCNWAAFTGDLRAAGGFDANFGPGSPTGATGQEAEMQERLLARGVRQVDVPDALVWHYVPEERSTLRVADPPEVPGRHPARAGGDANEDPAALHEVRSHLVRCALSTAKRTVLLDRSGWWQALLTLSYWVGAWQGYRPEWSRTRDSQLSYRSGQQPVKERFAEAVPDLLRPGLQPVHQPGRRPGLRRAHGLAGAPLRRCLQCWGGDHRYGGMDGRGQPAERTRVRPPRHDDRGEP